MQIPELTEHQVEVLTRAGNGSKYLTYTSIEMDGKKSELIDQLFAEDMQLVEWGLLWNISSLPKEQKVIKEMQEDEPREYLVLKATRMVELMFKRGCHSGAVN